MYHPPSKGGIWKNNRGNDLYTIIVQAISETEVDEINLSDLERRTGITRARLHRLKSNNFKLVPHGRLGQHVDNTVLSGFTGVLGNLLSKGVTNSVVFLELLQNPGHLSGQPQIEMHLLEHKDLIPAKRQMINPQGNRGFSYYTDPGGYTKWTGASSRFMMRINTSTSFPVLQWSASTHHSSKCYFVIRTRRVLCCF